MLAESLALLSFIFMLLYVLTKKRSLATVSWFTLSLACISNITVFLAVEDYFNAVVFLIGSIIFILIPLNVKKDYVLFQTTRFSALALATYLPFAVTSFGNSLIEITTFLTAFFGKTLGYEMVVVDHVIILNGKYIEIILACTAIESIALFTGATLGVEAKATKKLLAFAVSVPVIYFLNILRNVFVIVSYAYLIFGEDSFYIAHHVISKILATFALFLIAYIVFKILPELFDLISSLLSEVFGGKR
ncbi:MAG: archaeosortase A [Archaeoglobaceae archaeon]|nr:archaeosortase A [Archaeoglobaceae archaeon]MCX8152267.1 archaeosortase A [Archaeoglobaceae archaeon]MDW8013945.1 archaeosortase A [Archaeoglobaceae archaeon]